MQSFKSRELVTELFAWRHYYWFLTDDGIEYLRTYLNLPSEIVPATLKKSTRPLEKDGGRPPRRDYGDRPPRREGGFSGPRYVLTDNSIRLVYCREVCTHELCTHKSYVVRNLHTGRQSCLTQLCLHAAIVLS